MFDEKSRYRDTEEYQLNDRRGRTIVIVAVPPTPLQETLGYHVLKQGERMDHLAAKYFNNAAGFWRIAQLNDAMLPESLTEKAEIAIPSSIQL